MTTAALTLPPHRTAHFRLLSVGHGFLDSRQVVVTDHATGQTITCDATLTSARGLAYDLTGPSGFTDTIATDLPDTEAAAHRIHDDGRGFTALATDGTPLRSYALPENAPASYFTPERIYAHDHSTLAAVGALVNQAGFVAEVIDLDHANYVLQIVEDIDADKGFWFAASIDDDRFFVMQTVKDEDGYFREVEASEVFFDDLPPATPIPALATTLIEHLRTRSA